MTFEGMRDEELADVWYALAGAEIRHPGCFTALLEATNSELLRRRGDGLAAFVEERFRPIRDIDVADDAIAGVKATSDASCD